MPRTQRSWDSYPEAYARTVAVLLERPQRLVLEFDTWSQAMNNRHLFYRFLTALSRDDSPHREAARAFKARFAMKVPQRDEVPNNTLTFEPMTDSPYLRSLRNALEAEGALDLPPLPVDADYQAPIPQRPPVGMPAEAPKDAAPPEPEPARDSEGLTDKERWDEVLGSVFAPIDPKEPKP